MPAVRRTPVLTIILASYLMIVLDISIVITALPKIHYGLGFSATELSWVQNAYTLAFGGLLLLGARAGDIPSKYCHRSGMTTAGCTASVPRPATAG